LTLLGACAIPSPAGKVGKRKLAPDRGANETAEGDQRMKIAIVGTGIAGLTAAYHLYEQHDITVFEQNGYIGGHANTVAVRDGEREIGLDTGFIVYNETTYPHFTRLLKALHVPTQLSEMSFSVQCDCCALEYCGRSIRGLFARGDQLLRPRFYRMLWEVFRFNRLGAAALRAPIPADRTLGDFLRQHHFSREFVRHYVTPMASAIWSMSTADAGAFPLEFFLRFFANHGLLSVANQPAWRTITGGSRRYVAALTKPFADRIQLKRPVRSVRRHAGGVKLGFDGGATQSFDRLVLAAHADQALAMLTDPSDAEARALGALRYQQNEAVLHTDHRLLPRNRHAWASWNYHMVDCERIGSPLPMTYYLNCLQQLDATRPYCVTLNDSGCIRPECVIKRIPYEHPLFTADSLRAQAELNRLNGQRHTYFCGAYLGFGFHEDGAKAGLAAAEALTAGRAAA